MTNHAVRTLLIAVAVFQLPVAAQQSFVHDPNGTEIAPRPAVVDAPLDKGHVLLFSNNPIWRGETDGSHFVVYNALMNFHQLGAGRQLDAK